MSLQQTKKIRATAAVASGHLLCVTEDFAACSWENVFVIVWRARTRAVDAQEIQRLLKDFSETHHQGYFLLNIVEENAPPPDRQARQAIANYLKAGADHIVAGAVVLRGGLLRLSFVRGVVTGLVLLARQPFPFRVCSPESAIELFSVQGEKRGIPFRAGEFLDALQQLQVLIDGENSSVPSGIRAKFTRF